MSRTFFPSVLIIFCIVFHFNCGDNGVSGDDYGGLTGHWLYENLLNGNDYHYFGFYSDSTYRYLDGPSTENEGIWISDSNIIIVTGDMVNSYTYMLKGSDSLYLIEIATDSLRKYARIRYPENDPTAVLGNWYWEKTVWSMKYTGNPDFDTTLYPEVQYEEVISASNTIIYYYSKVTDSTFELDYDQDYQLAGNRIMGDDFNDYSVNNDQIYFLYHTAEITNNQLSITVYNFIDSPDTKAKYVVRYYYNVYPYDIITK